MIATPSVDSIEQFQENVPHIKHDFQQRQEYMKNGDWNGQDLFRQLWHGNFNNVSGSNPQGTAECKLANYIGFFFGRNEEIIKYFMSSLPFETHYEQYDTHRKILLDFAMSVDWVYCEGVSFAAKAEVAYAISKEGRTTVQEIKQITSIQERHIQYIIQILKAEGVIDVHTENHGEYIITNEGIVEEYLRDIESVIAEYEGEECSIKVDKSHPNTRMVPI